MTALEDYSIFKLDNLPNLPYEKDKFVQMDVTIEMNLDLGLIYRSGYNILDVLSDIGGMQSMIVTAFSVLLGIWNGSYKGFEHEECSKYCGSRALLEVMADRNTK